MVGIVGVVLGALTVRVKLVLALRVPSLTVSVIVAVPTWPLAGVTVTVRFPPLPPNTMFALGTSVGLEELADTVRLVSGVRASLTVKASGPVEPPALMVRLAMLERVGGVLTLP